MENTSVNLCEKCPIEQDCCRHLTGLKLTGREFEELFAPYQNLLTVRKIGPVHEISINNRGPCPHWLNGCAVYEKRAVECRLFPYTINEIKMDRKRVTLTYHARTRCPFKNELLPFRKEAEEMIHTFAREAFGEGVSVKIKYESGFYRAKSTVPKLRRIGSFVKRKWRKIGSKEI